MIPEAGFFALILALFIAAVQAIVPLAGAARNDANLMALASHAAIACFAFTALSFVALAASFVLSDFSVSLVASSSELAKPLIYKITGVWANHEGSMLLWVLILTLFGAGIAVFGSRLPPTLKARVLAVQGMIGTGFLLFIVMTSNPFARLVPAPADGSGMNPLLQDPGLALHPPLLYLGYVGFSVAFSFAVAALIEGRVDAAWARWVRPWVLAAWSCLTLGITLGSFWAYYILGWGGWWFWDPVENVSLMPWLAGTALLHSALVVERRHALVNWTILLAILTFSLSLIGTFVVRSGVLTSVHSFAQDPARGVFILVLLVGATGGALLLYALRIPALKFGAPFAAVSRESGLALNNVLLVSLAATVFLGTFYPLALDLLGYAKISVGPPYYAKTFVPIAVLLLIAMVVGPTLKWKRDSLLPNLRSLGPAVALAVVGAVATAILDGGSHLWAAACIGLALWIIAGSLMMFVNRIKLGRQPLAQSLTLARHAPRSFYGLVLAHLGVGLVVAAVVTVTTWQQEKVTTLAIGETTEIGGATVTLLSVSQGKGPNYEFERGVFTLALGGSQATEVTAERQFFTTQQRTITETGIRTNLISNFYFVLADPAENDRWVVRFYYQPLAPWLWFGGMVMAAGGVLSLSDRRFRVGVPQRLRSALKPAVA